MMHPKGVLMEDHFLMSHKERESLKVLTRVKAKSLNLRQASELLHISYRQCLRRYKRFLTQGDKGLIHRSRGKPSNRTLTSKTKEAIVDLYKMRYPDFGPTLASEKLAKDGYLIDHETLRRLLIKQGLWQKRRARSPHRSWRERRAHFGELVQLDGSHHPWFENRAEGCCLMNMVDDATGITLALLDHQESILSAMRLLWRWIIRYGIPSALYTDRKNIYVASDEAKAKAKLEGREPMTQFGRACKELGIRIIEAHSPQAKGRVERSNGVYQDRLVKELRLADISDIESANELLEAVFIDELNEKFAVEAREPADYHRSANGYDLADTFSIKDERSISRDWIVRFDNSYYQLERQSRYAPARAKVEVKRYLNGELHIYYRGREGSYEQLDERPAKKAKAKTAYKGGSKGKPRPAKDHPWQRTWSKRQRMKNQAEAKNVTFLKS